MNEKLVEKIIGASYVAHNEKLFIADIYEGNYYKVVEGGTVKTISLPKREYDRVLSQYQECVRQDIMITSAYEMNKRANLHYEISSITADPEAAEKEWYIRKHPQVVAIEEPKRKKRGLFSRKAKSTIGIKCLECGVINKEGQKFCGECGAKLVSAKEEIPAVKPAESSSVGKTPVPTPAETKPAPSGPAPERAEDPPKNTDDLQIMNLDEEPDESYEEDDYMYEEDPLPEPDQTFPPAPEPSKKDAPLRASRKKVKAAPRKEPEEQPRNTRKASRKKKKRWPVVLIILLLMLLLLGCGAAGYFFLYGGGIDIIYDSNTEADKPTGLAESMPEETVVPFPSTEAVNESYVVIKLKNDIPTNQAITEDDLEGTILSSDQFEKYNKVSTYVGSDGQIKEEALLLWEDRASIIGKYAARDLSAGSILYDTALTSQHVVADKTYVDVEVDGETKSYESSTDILPGNTKIQIVAIIQTDNGQPSQVLLSEMTLQDRSLQSIFDSAGKDILEMLSGDENAPADSTEEDTAITEETEGQQ